MFNNFGGCVTKREETDKKCGVDASSTSTSDSDDCLRIVLPAGINTVIIVKDDKLSSSMHSCRLQFESTGRELNVLCYCVLKMHKLLYFDGFICEILKLRTVLHEYAGIMIQFERVCFCHSVWSVINTTCRVSAL